MHSRILNAVEFECILCRCNEKKNAWFDLNCVRNSEKVNLEFKNAISSFLNANYTLCLLMDPSSLKFLGFVVVTVTFSPLSLCAGAAGGGARQ